MKVKIDKEVDVGKNDRCLKDIKSAQLIMKKAFLKNVFALLEHNNQCLIIHETRPVKHDSITRAIGLFMT